MNTLNQPQPPTPSTQSGFTLIECLIAIIIVSVLMVAIAPAVVLSTATRLQARRVEMATQAARTYVDGVRSGSIATPNFIQEDLSKPISDVRVPAAITLTCPNAPISTPGASPSGNYYCYNAPPTSPSISVQSLYCINLDGKGCADSNNRSSKNMIVQAFRSVTPNPTDLTKPNLLDNGTKGYILGVRVYRLDAFDGSNAPLKKTQQTNRRMATYTAGVGDRQSPLVELTTEIAPENQSNDPSGRWKALCSRLGGCKTPTPTVSPPSL